MAVRDPAGRARRRPGPARPADPAAGRVAAYYERNTRSFLRFGGGGSSGTIHRQLWGTGVTDTDQAARYVHRLIAAELGAPALPAAPVLLDLGCGVGGTVLELAAQFPAARVHGVTISPTQCGIARRTAERHGLAHRCSFHTENFETARLRVRADAAFAVESFVHSTVPGAFFETAAAHLRPGARLIVVDDFLSADTRRAARLSGRFRRGWRAPAFMSADASLALARRAGFESVDDRDLTGLIRTNRLRHRLVALIAPACRAAGLVERPAFGNLIGGHALNAGLRGGEFTYRRLVFRRAGRDSSRG